MSESPLQLFIGYQLFGFTRARSLSIILEDVKIVLPKRDLTNEQHKQLHSIAEGAVMSLKS